ncbi:hypothetical protein [Vibrio natriegens]|uniref:Uncharacterized protein n=1 Tax=Vibrio natriegens NBRC 15636 = ATCC 14048 = DSM 759 TaxID=1219067 RepID=A0AAN0Y1V1_VIBNA|nr:hypothetical protein [Vibrio natriegens]ALR15721.1 hypothetical protein PN96_06890 [Vibrio natriegens NBRC 15636 = ATCC 14048 = DSM 759]ANQ12420.1 hypothetical protein BA890_06460 [Vibrio natriegens NBRC 15636 = ATCC 14048 = DSM 759]EPM42479.1 hypothetical protein M272_00505 [Vibrio natriegens NBRC 15636 = ATCC 14048 = DSM 759]MDX6026801.1 hypothetical protein [Vibrio natriegens NBRC 15636 = ATCC 14048 = DSM 759]UUI12883.1 hypothetical protein NP431_06470 [Vibrio natriegens]
MSWINLSSVTVSNGSKTVTINSGLTTNVKVGDALLIGNEAPVEISGVFASQLILRSNWPNPTVTNAAAAVMPTSGEFTTATQALREATNVTQGNFAEMEKWWTELGTVTFKAYDNTEHEVRTAKQMDEEVQQTQDDMVANIEANMVAKIGEVSSENIDWDVDIGFNDGAKITKGYGTSDANGNRVADFTRASDINNINKSGALEPLTADEIAVTQNGVLFHAGYTQKLLFSDDLVSWYVNSTNAAITTDAVTIDGYVCDNLETLIATTSATLTSRSLSVVSGNNYYINAIVDVDSDCDSVVLVGKDMSSLGWQSGYVNLADGSSGSTSVDWEFISFEKITPRLAKVQVKVSADLTGTTGSVTLAPAVLGGIASAGVSINIAAVWVAEIVNAPYVQTTSATKVVAPSMCSIPLMNNMPAPGNPFTIMFDADIPQGRHSVLGFNSVTSLNFTVWRFSPGGDFILRLSDDQGNLVNATVPSAESVGLKRYAVRFDGAFASMAVNGSVKGKVSTAALVWPEVYDVGGVGYLGTNAQSNGNALNSTLKNFRIVHRALSNDEIKALGAAQ